MRHRLLLFIVNLMLCFSAWAQQTVSGTVKSSTDKSPLLGVTVLVNGTTLGTVTDRDGKFSLDVSPTDVLTFQFIGYKTHVETVGSRQEINVMLSEDIALLNEVTVVGYGTQKRSDVTGALGSIKPKDIQALPSARLDEVIQGRVAGVDIQNNNNEPGSSPTIRIRGVNSITGDNNPLIVIDGFIGGDLKSIHPNDIVSFEVLKDASATAIYGSRGANGVILITTKDGSQNKDGRVYVFYSSNVFYNILAKKLDLMNSYEYALTRNNWALQVGKDVVFSDDQLAKFKNGEMNTDWQDEIFTPSWSQNHHINISSGSKKYSYNISMNGSKEKGILIGPSSYETLSLRPNLAFIPNDKISFKLNSYLSWSFNNITASGAHRGPTGSPILSTLAMPPTYPVYDEDNDYNTTIVGGLTPGEDYLNPVALALEPVREAKSSYSNINGTIQYRIIKKLTLRTSLRYDWSYYRRGDFDNRKPRGDDPQLNATASISYSESATLQNTNTISYYTTFFRKHNIDVAAVYEWQKSESFGFGAGAQGFFEPRLLYYNLSTGQKVSNPYSYSSERVIESIVGRFNYSYESKYLFTATGRYDGSSVFGENNKRAFFPSVALGWNVHKESFLSDNISWINELKLRGGYGKVGSQAVGAYQTIRKAETGATASQSLDGTTVASGISLTNSERENPNLKWETTSQWNVGVDMKFLKGRHGLSFDYYQKYTEDLIQRVQIPQQSGSSYQYRNIGEVSNRGFEITLTAVPVNIPKKFTWSTSISFAQNINKIEKLYEADKVVLPYGFLPGTDGLMVLQENQPIGTVRGFIYEGVWKSDEATEANKVIDNEQNQPYFPGAPKYRDIDGNGRIDDNDRTVMGKMLPIGTFGWNNTISYKNFNLTFFFQGSYGNDVLNLGRYITEGGGISTPTHKRILNRWSTLNPDTDVPSVGGDRFSKGAFSSRWVEDGSYIRLKNVVLVYDVPYNWLSKIKISGIRIRASVTNLFTLTKYTGFDPEASTPSGATHDQSRGIDVAAYPAIKKFSLGIDIKF